MKTDYLYLVFKDNNYIVTSSKTIICSFVGISRGQLNRFLLTGNELTKTGYTIKSIQYLQNSRKRA